jgi:serine protease Do
MRQQLLTNTSHLEAASFTSFWTVCSILARELVLAFSCCAFCLTSLQANPSLLLEEEKALQAAGDFAQSSVVRVETFGGREIVEDSAVAAGPSTGTVVDADGWIITSLFQFRADPPAITVVLSNGERKSAKLVARDHARALALLKIDVAEPLTVATLSPRSTWQVGQWTIALGKTFDLAIASRSAGILSATDRIFGRAIQTDCKISPHNYGGPLIDLQGRVMGILAPIDPGIATEGEVQQWYDSGIGFAIPLDDILARLPKLKSGVDIHSGKAGIRPKRNDDFRGPVELAGVSPGTPAAKAGLKSGDRILKVGSTDIRWPNHLRHALGVVDAENQIAITVERDGKTLEYQCELVKELPVYRTPFIGVLADAAHTGGGVKVMSIYPDGPFDEAGLESGSIIQAVSGKKIASVEDLDRELAFIDYREPFKLSIADSKAPNVVRDVTLNATPWPNDWSNSKPTDGNIEKEIKVLPKREKKITTGIVPIAMGDIPNQVFAFVPPNYSQNITHGLLVVMPDPGKVDRKQWTDRWEVFCREHHFIVAVVASADPTTWQREELDVTKRTIQHLKNKYTIDARRIVIGGMGAGGTPAFVLALQNRSLFRGLWLVESKLPRALRPPQAEPLETPAMLFQGENPAYPKFVKAIRDMGYRATAIEEKVDLASQAIDLKQQDSVENFLRSLEWF